MAQPAVDSRRNLSGLIVTGVVTATLSTSLLHHAIPLTQARWHDLFQHMYYLPIVVAALRFGWLGGLCAAVLAGASHLPYIYLSGNVAPEAAAGQLMEIPLFCLAGLLTGILSDRERRQRRDLQRTTTQLASVYRELQDNFDHMKRAERMYALGQLSAGLAHEIRNPLASIAGATAILERHPADRTRDECVGIVKKEADRLNRLLTSFLAFARPRPPRFRTIELGPTLDTVMDLAGHAVDRRPVTLRQDIPAELPPIECDPEQITQVLLNLLINAVQATEGEGEVTLAARAEGPRVLIQVRDQGSGIAPENREKVFDPFFTTKEQGTGLGLSVAHQIVEQHGGVITAESNPDRGATFTLLLPVKRENLG